MPARYMYKKWNVTNKNAPEIIERVVIARW